MEERKHKQNEFQKAASDRYVEQVEWPKREREMQETFRQLQNAKEVDEKVRKALEVKEENKRLNLQQHAITLQKQVHQ